MLSVQRYKVTSKVGPASYGAALDLLKLRHLHRQAGRVTTIGWRTPTCPFNDERGSRNGSIPSLGSAIPHHPNAAIYNTFNIQRHLISRPILRRFRAKADAAWAAAVL